MYMIQNSIVFQNKSSRAVALYIVYWQDTINYSLVQHTLASLYLHNS